MGYYSLDPEDVSRIIGEYLQTNHTDSVTLNDINKIFMDHYQKESVSAYLRYANNYPSKFLHLLNAYHQNKDEFEKTFKSLHTEEIQKLKLNVTKKKYKIKLIIKAMLNDENCEKLEVQSIAAICSLNRLYTKIFEIISTSLFYSDYFEGLLNAYGNVLFDIECLSGCSSRRELRGANSEIFPLSKQMMEYNFTYQYPVAESAIFLIRQAIEVHIKRGLGIKSLQNNIKSNNSSKQDVPISAIITFLKQGIEEKKIALSIDIRVLRQINKWSNSYIHTGKFNYPFWYVEWIQNYLNNFFYVHEDIKKLYKSIEQNISASIFVEKDYAANINALLRQRFSNSELITYSRTELIIIESAEIITIQEEIKRIEERYVEI
jgi:hypothetical protein